MLNGLLRRNVAVYAYRSNIDACTIVHKCYRSKHRHRLAIFLFLAKDAVAVAVVMVVYTAMAVYGYLTWKKEMAR